jgi:arylsulfatase A-like enzyme
MNKPNILLLTVDALRRDRLGFSGYKYDTSPVIDSLTKNSIWCDNSFSLAPSTQPSMPSIVTSSKPLSYGGYDLGIKNRPNPLAKVLKNSNYETHNLITFPWLRGTYGYDIGFDQLDHLYNITGIVGATIHTIRSHILAYENKIIDSQEMLKKASPLILQCFNDMEDFSLSQIERLTNVKKVFLHSYFAVQDYDYKCVIDVVRKHRHEFEKDREGYINKRIVGLPQQAVNFWISKDIKYKRKLNKRIELFSEKIISHSLNLFSQKESRLYRLKNKIYTDSTELANHLIDKIYTYAKSNKDVPFYMWTHFLDTHMPYCPGELPNWSKSAKKYLKDVGYKDRNYDLSCVYKRTPDNIIETEVWNAAYDSSIRYTDKQIGKILKALDETGLRESTLIVIAGDHGEEIGEHGEYGHRFRFYEESINVPMIFHMPHLEEKRISGLSDLSDIAPTILGFAGIEIPDTYTGHDLTKNKNGKKYIQMEVFHRGNCLFKYKPLYMSIRTDNFKYIWKEWKDEEDVSGGENVELYNINEDRGERVNIAKQAPEVISSMQDIVAKRLSELPDYIDNRSKKSLDDNGVSKYLKNDAK